MPGNALALSFSFLADALAPAHFLAAFTGGLRVLLPLAIACVALIALIPTAAVRSRLHIPAYAGLALLSFVLAILFGWFSGAPRVTRTIAGFCLSILFFLLMASAAGCVLALFFYRHPPEA
jgi:hypothetical protein